MKQSLENFEIINLSNFNFWEASKKQRHFRYENEDTSSTILNISIDLSLLLVTLCSTKTQWQASLLTIKLLPVSICQAGEMDGANVFQLEDLPAEMFIEIFRYLSARELYLSFPRLNICLDSVLKSFCNLFLVIACHWEPILVFFDSFNVAQIYFSDFNSSTLSQFKFSSLLGVRLFNIL